MTLLPLMNIADKYQIESIRTSIAKQIQVDWPSSLGKWDARRGNREFELEPVAALIFAPRFGIKEVLPAAMYALACTPYSSGWVEGERPGIMLDGRPAGRRRSARWELVSADLHMELGRLRDDLINMMRGFCQSIFTNDHRPGIYCASRTMDMSWLSTLERDVERQYLDAGANVDVLELLLNVPREEALKQEAVLCGSCMARVRNRRDQKRKEVWEFLVNRCMSIFLPFYMLQMQPVR